MSTTSIHIHRHTKGYGTIIDVCEHVAGKTDRSAVNALVWMLRCSPEYQDAREELEASKANKEPIVPSEAGESPEASSDGQ